MNTTTKIVILLCVLAMISLLIFNMTAFHIFLYESQTHLNSNVHETEDWLHLKRGKNFKSNAKMAELRHQEDDVSTSPSPPESHLSPSPMPIVNSSKAIIHGIKPDRKRKKRDALPNGVIIIRNDSTEIKQADDKYFHWKFSLNVTRYENQTQPSAKYNSTASPGAYNSTDEKYLGMAVFVEGRDTQNNDLNRAWSSVGSFLRNLFGSDLQQEVEMSVGDSLPQNKQIEQNEQISDVVATTVASGRAGRFLFNFWGFGGSSPSGENNSTVEISADMTTNAALTIISDKEPNLNVSASSVTPKNTDKLPNTSPNIIDDVEISTVSDSGISEVPPTVSDTQESTSKISESDEILTKQELSSVPPVSVPENTSQIVPNPTTEPDFVSGSPKTELGLTDDTDVEEITTGLGPDITAFKIDADLEKYCLDLFQRLQQSPRFIGMFDFFGSGDNEIEPDDSQRSFSNLEGLFSSLVSNSSSENSSDYYDLENGGPEISKVDGERGARFLGLDRWFPSIFGSGSVARQVDDGGQSILFDGESLDIVDGPSISDCEAIIRDHLKKELRFSKPNLLDILKDPDLTIQDFTNELDGTSVTKSPKVIEKEMEFLRKLIRESIQVATSRPIDLSDQTDSTMINVQESVTDAKGFTGDSISETTTQKEQERRLWSLLNFQGIQQTSVDTEATSVTESITMSTLISDLGSTEKQHERIFGSLFNFGSEERVEITGGNQDDGTTMASVVSMKDSPDLKDSGHPMVGSEVVSTTAVNIDDTTELGESRFIGSLLNFGSGGGGLEDESRLLGFLNFGSGREEIKNEAFDSISESEIPSTTLGVVDERIRETEIPSTLPSVTTENEFDDGTLAPSIEDERRFFGVLFGSGERSVEILDATTEVQDRIFLGGLVNFGSGEGRLDEETTSTESQERRFLGFINFGSGEGRFHEVTTEDQEGRILGFLNFGSGERNLDTKGTSENGSITETPMLFDDCESNVNLDDSGKSSEIPILDDCENDCLFSHTNESFLKCDDCGLDVENVALDEFRSASTSIPTLGPIDEITSILNLRPIDYFTVTPISLVTSDDKTIINTKSNEVSSTASESFVESYNNEIIGSTLTTKANASPFTTDQSRLTFDERGSTSSTKSIKLGANLKDDEMKPTPSTGSQSPSSDDRIFGGLFWLNSGDGDLTLLMEDERTTFVPPPVPKRGGRLNDDPLEYDTSKLDDSSESTIPSVVSTDFTQLDPKNIMVDMESRSTVSLSTSKMTTEANDNTDIPKTKLETTAVEFFDEISTISEWNITEIPQTSTEYFTTKNPPMRYCTSAKDCNSTLNERCVTKHSLPVCDCGRGYVRHPTNRKCEDKIVMETSIRFPEERFEASLLNPTSEKYKKTAKNAIDTMTLLLGENPALLAKVAEVQVTSFDEGSLIVRWNLVVAADDNETLNEVMEIVDYQLRHAFQNEQLLSRAPLKTRNVILLSITNALNPCQSPELNYCSKFATCTQDARRPGGFRCECRSGYPDTSEHRDTHPGENCQALCTKEFCGQNGVCQLKDNGELHCLCNGWYFGNHCQISGIVVIASFLSVNLFMLFLAVLFLCIIRYRRRQTHRYENRGSNRSRRDGRLTDVIPMQDARSPTFRFVPVYTAKPSPIRRVARATPSITVTPASLSNSEDSRYYGSTFNTTPSQNSHVSIEVFEDPEK